jgi:hypothetical protein
MPTNTYTPIGSITLASATALVSFSSIPSTYRDLVFVFAGDGSSGGADIAIQLNGDGGNNYDRVFMVGNGTSPSSGSNSNVSRMDALTVANGRQTSMVCQFMDSSATDKHKTVLTRDNDTGLQVGARAFRWANTAAITSMQIFVTAGNFNTGSTFTLYGVVA